MDVTPLETACARVLEAAAGGPSPARSDGEWPAELVLAHLITANRAFSVVTAEVLAGRAPGYDNRASTFRPHLEAVVRASGGWDELVETFRRSGQELMALAALLDDEQGATPIHILIVDDGRTFVDEPRPWAAFLAGSANFHIPLHLDQLAKLRASA